MPPHFNAAHVGVEVEKGANADGLGHDLIQLWPLGGVQVQHAEDELAQVGAVPVRYRGKRPAHDLQHQGREILRENERETYSGWAGRGEAKA